MKKILAKFVALAIILARGNGVCLVNAQQQQVTVSVPNSQLQSTFFGMSSIVTNIGTLGTLSPNSSPTYSNPSPSPSTNNLLQSTKSFESTQTTVPNTNSQAAGRFQTSATTKGFELWSNNNATRKLRMGLLMANGYYLGLHNAMNDFHSNCCQFGLSHKFVSNRKVFASNRKVLLLLYIGLCPPSYVF